MEVFFDCLLQISTITTDAPARVESKMLVSNTPTLLTGRLNSNSADREAEVVVIEVAIVAKVVEKIFIALKVSGVDILKIGVILSWISNQNS